VTRLSDPLALRRGPALSNRLMLAPLTNQQSHADGTLSDAEFHWLTMRAKGGFALTMTCAAHVQKGGQASPASHPQSAPQAPFPPSSCTTAAAAPSRS
jgi:2,4-dienoyl-CoA reductase-like NADH-dependent reductase (Old Yellow Enzyme family)